jgi:hypothetical protein
MATTPEQPTTSTLPPAPPLPGPTPPPLAPAGDEPHYEPSAVRGWPRGPGELNAEQRAALDWFANISEEAKAVFLEKSLARFNPPVGEGEVLIGASAPGQIPPSGEIDPVTGAPVKPDQGLPVGPFPPMPPPPGASQLPMPPGAGPNPTPSQPRPNPAPPPRAQPAPPLRTPPPPAHRR